MFLIYNEIMPEIHVGSLIKEELKRQERSISWFARKLYCDRSNVYDIFRRKSIDTDLLLRISHVLNHDFFQYYCRFYKESSACGKFTDSSIF